MGEQTQHCNAHDQQISLSRYVRNQMEAYTLTGGGLRLGLVFLQTKKSAESIVIADTGPSERKR
jgi:hypothetical protein